jgi:RNA polymerase sigma factor (sigma-70 family)
MSLRIPDLATEQVRAAAAGDLASADALLRAIEPGVFNLALRMLGNREDAADASQEILLRVLTHLGGFRGEAAFSTWVYRIARHHLLNAVTRTREADEVSFESIAGKLSQGLAYGREASMPVVEADLLGPEDKAEMIGIAIGCTQGMLMALDREHRLVYLLDVVFGLDSAQAAEVLDITAAAYRKRLSRARARLDDFMQGTCGLRNADAPCRCPAQRPALRARAAMEPTPDPGRLRPEAGEIATAGLARAEFARWRAFGDAAAIFRGHPDYRSPEGMVGAIRALLSSQGYLKA